MLKKLCLLAIAIVTIFSMDIGMNIHGICDWNTEMPFVDVAKMCRPWIVQNSVWVSSGENPWDTGYIDHIPFDENGYPLYMPVHVEGAETTQVVSTLMNRELGREYPPGRYTVLYDGTGELSFGFAATEVSHTEGRYEIDVEPIQDGIFMTIEYSDPDDHITNIRVIMQDHEDDYIENPFNPEFLEKIGHFKAIRFMDWGATNDNPIEHWEDRTQATDYTQFSDNGIAYEYMCKLCNITNMDMWICVPHAADTTFIRNLAELVRDSLNPELTIYLEYSNEVWNGMFSQYSWVDEHGNPELNHHENYAMFAERVFNIWLSVFDDDSRIVRVASGQHANIWVMEQVMNYLGPDGADAISPAAYISISDAGYDELALLGESATADNVFPYVYNMIDDWGYSGILEHKWLADSLGMQLLFYEGGQHIVTSPFGSWQSYLPALWDAQIDDRMYELYNNWLSTLRDTIDADLFMHFSFASHRESQYGSWGALEIIYDDSTDSPKYKALLENLPEDPGLIASEEHNLPKSLDFVTYPNPFNNGIRFNITSDNSQYIGLEIYNILGSCIYEREYSDNEQTLYWQPSENIRSGIYFAKIRNGNEKVVKKIIYQK